MKVGQKDPCVDSGRACLARSLEIAWVARRGSQTRIKVFKTM